MKIFFSPFRKKAYMRAMAYMFWHPEYSELAYRGLFASKRLCVLRKKDQEVIDAARADLARENHRIPEELRYNNLKDK